MKKTKLENGYILENNLGIIHVSYNYNFGKKETLITVTDKKNDITKSVKRLSTAKSIIETLDFIPL